MLLDDKKRLVEVYMENVLWGNVTLLYESIESGFQLSAGERIRFRDNLQKWCLLRVEKQSNIEFEKLTTELYQKILDFRIVGLLRGKFEDPDSTIQKLTEENKQLASHLSQSYIPSKDPKIGTT